MPSLDPPPGAPPPSRLRTWLSAWPLLVALVVFAPTLGFGFVDWDDPIHLLDNPLVRRPGSVSWLDHLRTPALGYPMPLPILTYRLEVAAAGLGRAWVHHATNVVLHLIVVALVARLGRRLGLSAAATALAATCFGVHPAVAETVSWISGRKDLLASAFGLGALLVSLGAQDLRAPRRISVILLLILALLCKPIAMCHLVTIPLLRRARYGSRLRDELRALWPFAALVALALPLALLGQHEVGALATPRSPAFHARMVWYALGFHLDLIGLLQEPAAKYYPPIVPPPFTPRVDLAPLVLVGLLVALHRRCDPPRRTRLAALGLCAVATYAPSSSLVPLVRYLADTYVYLPLAFVALLLGLAADRFFESLGARRRLYELALPLVAATLLAMLAVPASARFHDTVALWKQAMEVSPHHWQPCLNWASALEASEGPAARLEAIERCALRFGPERFEKDRGIALYHLGRLDEALAQLELASAHRPDDAELRAFVARLRLARP